jgi:prephenate dehydratase
MSQICDNSNHENCNSRSDWLVSRPSGATVFWRHNANLTKLESRPVRGQPFKYQFFVAVETNPTTLDQIVTKLTAQQCQVRVLGTYIANGP